MPFVRTAGLVASSVVGLRARPSLWNDCIAISATSSGHAPYTLQSISSGTATSSTAVGHPGITRLQSSTNANSGMAIRTQSDYMATANGDYFECIFNIVTLANLTVRLGFLDSTTSADAVDGVYFEIASTGVATPKTSSNSSRTSNATTATLSAATWYRAEIDVLNTTNDTRFRIYNSDTGAVVLAEQTNTTNIPTGASRAVGIGIVATNSGTSATDLVDVDLIGYENRFGVTR